MPSTSTKTVAVILTCFNRVKKTMKCLDEVFAQASDDDLDLEVFLVDDGSTDGTADAVKSRFPQVKVLMGDGSLFWNRGMHLAFGEALKKGYDYYLWLNDDTHLYKGAINTLMNIHKKLLDEDKPNSIVITSTRDPLTGKFTYGGYRRYGGILNPLKLQLIQPTDNLESCDTFCGNCVLIPREVADKVGNINPIYLHRWGDVDYGLRALELHCQTWVAPDYLAECEDNPMADRWKDSTLSFRDKIKELHSLKGVGRHDWPKYVRRHGGILWPIFLLRPYVRVIFDTIRHTTKTLFSRILGH